VLCAYARPTFLIITKPDEDNDIQVVISCLAFKTMNISERISYVFNLINKHIPDVMEDRLIIIQAFDPDEMIDVLEQIYLPEYYEMLEEDE
jgi:hypothetical protein